MEKSNACGIEETQNLQMTVREPGIIPARKPTFQHFKTHEEPRV
jgi:hypothetical protein